MRSATAGIQECPDEFEHALVGNPFSDARHQAVVVRSIQKFLEIKIDDDAVAVGNVALRLGYCLMSGPSRPEVVAMLGERRVPSCLQNLQQGLLNQAIDDTGHDHVELHF